MTIIYSIREMSIQAENASSNQKNQAEMTIINAVLRKENSDEEIDSFIKSQIKKGKTSEVAIISAANEVAKKQNRKLCIFSSFDEKNEFEKNNECGSSWENENGEICVYCYE